LRTYSLPERVISNSFKKYREDKSSFPHPLWRDKQSPRHPPRAFPQVDAGVYSRPIKSCSRSGIINPSVTKSGPTREDGTEGHGEWHTKFACADSPSVLWRLATGWRRFFAGGRKRFDPCEGQGRIGQSWRERSPRAFRDATTPFSAVPPNRRSGRSLRHARSRRFRSAIRVTQRGRHALCRCAAARRSHDANAADGQVSPRLPAIMEVQSDPGDRGVALRLFNSRQIAHTGYYLTRWPDKA